MRFFKIILYICDLRCLNKNTKSLRRRGWEPQKLKTWEPLRWQIQKRVKLSTIFKFNNVHHEISKFDD